MSHGILRHVTARAALATACLAALSACSSHAANDSGGDASTGDNDSSLDANPIDAGPEAAPIVIGPSGFPLGAFDNCSFDTFLQTPGGGGSTGHGGTLVVSQTGSTLVVGYGGDGGALDASFEFTPTSPNSATLVAGQELDGVQVSCAPLEFAPAVAQLASGSLTYEYGTLFFSVIGTAQALDAGGGCTNPGGQVAFVVTCGSDAAPSEGAREAESGPDGGVSDFVGVYTCASLVNQFQPGDIQASTSGSGTLTIAQTGDQLTAGYANDAFVQGSLGFVATAGNAAAQEMTNETILVTCFDGSNPSQQIPQVVRSTTLTRDGTSVVLSFAGNGCYGAQLTGSLLCAPPLDASFNDAR